MSLLSKLTGFYRVTTGRTWVCFLALVAAGLACGVCLAVALTSSGPMSAHAGAPANAATPEAAPRQEAGKVVVPDASPLRAELVIAPVTVQRVTRKLVLPAMVEADPARTAKVMPALSGHIIELKVALGDRVGQGQVLAVLSSADLAQAYDDDDKARSALQLAKKALERQRGLTTIQTGAVKDLAAAEDAYRQAEAEYERAETRLKVIGAAAGGREKGRVLTVRAPIAGTITDLEVAHGTFFNDPTQPLLTISQLDPVWVTAEVPEKDLTFVAKGQPVDVSLVADPSRPLHGTVLFVSDVLEPDTRRAKVRIAFANPDGAMKPNMFATTTFLAPEESQLVIPTSALLMNNDSTTVFVESAPGTFERRTIETGYDMNGSVVVTKGLSAGERIIVAGGVLLND